MSDPAYATLVKLIQKLSRMKGRDSLIRVDIYTLASVRKNAHPYSHRGINVTSNANATPVSRQPVNVFVHVLATARRDKHTHQTVLT